MPRSSSRRRSRISSRLSVDSPAKTRRPPSQPTTSRARAAVAGTRTATETAGGGGRTLNGTTTGTSRTITASATTATGSATDTRAGRLKAGRGRDRPPLDGTATGRRMTGITGAHMSASGRRLIGASSGGRTSTAGARRRPGGRVGRTTGPPREAAGRQHDAAVDVGREQRAAALVVWYAVPPAM
jgi:hypothetical protein